MNHPLLLLGLTAGALYVLKLWCDDLRAARNGRPAPAALPGATAAPRRAIIVAALGALVLVALETGGEIALGLSAQQSRITAAFAVYSVIGAPVIEELIFRGWLVVENRGRVALWSGAAVASLLFALLHPFLWQWDDSGLRLSADAKGAFSTVMVFCASLWFYIARFARWNPQRSLLPCFAAHAAKNAAVVAVKAAQGFWAGAW